MSDITDFHVDEMTPSVFDSHSEENTLKDPSSSGPALTSSQDQQETLPTSSKHNNNYMDIVQLIIKLTSPEKIDYDIVSDLFLTYRSFLSSSTLLQLLILRFKWALRCFDDRAHEQRHIEGEKVLVRTFTVIRHWLLNYFKDDFAPCTSLRLLFVNYFTKLAHEDFAVQRIISNLQNTYNDQNKRAINDNDKNNEHSPQYRNSVIINSATDRGIVPNIPMQYSKRDPKLFLNPKNSNLRLSQLALNSNDNKNSTNNDPKSRDGKSPLFVSLNKSPLTRNVVTQPTAFPTNSAISKIIPPTPVKKMEVIVKLPIPPPSASSNSTTAAAALKYESKGLKSLIDKWTNTFNANKQTTNKDVQVEKFMQRVVSLPRLNDKELEELIVGKFDILSARTIDQVEYLFKFQNELFNRYSSPQKVFGRDSFSFTVDADINRSNIDNMNLCGYISNLSKSVVSLQHHQQQAAAATAASSEKSYVTYDSDLSRNSVREFDFESREEGKEEEKEEEQEELSPVGGVVVDHHNLKKVDTIEEFNKHFSVLSQSTRNFEMPTTVSPEFSIGKNKDQSSITDDSQTQVMKTSPTEETIKNLVQVDDTASLSKVMKSSPTEETIKNLIEQEQTREQELEQEHEQEQNVDESKSYEKDIIADEEGSPSVVEKEEEQQPLKSEIPVEDVIVNESVVEQKNSEEEKEEKEVSEAAVSTEPEVEVQTTPDEFDFVGSQSNIIEEQIIPIPAATVRTETESEDEIDDVVSLYSDDGQSIKTPTSGKFNINRKSVILRSVNRRDSKSSATTFDDGSFMSSYEEPILQDTMSTNNQSDETNEPNTPTMHHPTPHVSPIKSITKDQDFADKEPVQPEMMRLDLNRIPSFTRISNGSFNSTHGDILRNQSGIVRDSYLSHRTKNPNNVSFNSDMMSTSSIFTPVRGRQNFVNISIAQEQEDEEDGGDEEVDEAELILQQKQTQKKQHQNQIQNHQTQMQQRDVSLQTVESEDFNVPYPGVDKSTLNKLADIKDESFHADPINAALSKLEGTYTKRTPSSYSTTSSTIARQVENLNIHSNPNSTKLNNNKRRSFFIDQRRKTKQFLLTPVLQKDIEEPNPRILLDLLINYQISNANLQLTNAPNHVSFILNYDSKTLANQFTLIEKDALLEIDWSELVELKWNSEEVKQINSWLEILIQNEKLNGIDLCISRFNLTVNWIISEILLTRDLNLRKLTIQRFIHIAQNCKALQNYSTLMQILLALSSDKVQKLKETWRNVEPGDILTFKNLEPILSPMKNFLNLRTELNKMKPSLGAAPFLGLYLSDLLFNKEKRTLKDGNKINFGKFQHDAKIIKSLIKCIQWSMLYKLEVDEEVLSKCLYIKSLTEDEMNLCLKDIY